VRIDDDLESLPEWSSAVRGGTVAGVHVDRTVFLALTAALASASACAQEAARAPQSAQTKGAGARTEESVTLDIPPLDAGVTTREPPIFVAEPAPTVPAVCPENAVGSLAACDAWKVDPTCESGGPRDECTSLMSGTAPDDGFQPRVAEKVAACMTAKPVTRSTGCKRPDMHKCIREGVDSVCIDPAMTAACEKLTTACKGRGHTPTFTVEQCARIATSTRGSMREWALEVMSGLHHDGTPMGEGCTLQYVTVYQPWPKNWWTGR
jgi:hypothetical protein